MNDQDDPLPSQEFFKSFDLGEAFQDVKDEFRFGSAKTKVSSAAKLLGKSLWNVGLGVAKNLPAHIEKNKQNMAKDAAARERKKLSFERKSNAELIALVKDGTEDDERKIAYDVLRHRKIQCDAQKS